MERSGRACKTNWWNLIAKGIGATLYRIAGDWGKTIPGASVEAMVANQNPIPNADALTKEQTLSRVQELGWSTIGFKSIVRMLFNMVTMKLKRICG